MTDPTLQAYYDAHDWMMDSHRGSWSDELDYRTFYRIARTEAVEAGLIPETPQFDVEDAR